jgi:hypothetical protein
MSIIKDIMEMETVDPYYCCTGTHGICWIIPTKYKVVDAIVRPIPKIEDIGNFSGEWVTSSDILRSGCFGVIESAEL